MQFVDNITPQNFAGYSANYGKTNDPDWRNQMWSDWATMYYQNAYNSAMANYMNEYNSPKQQMLRYQEAGLSPWLAEGQPGNMQSAPSGAAPKGNFKAPSNLEKTQVAISQTQQILKQAGEIYDYIQYGAPLKDSQLQLAEYNRNIAWQNMRKYTAEANWAEYWNYGPEYFHLMNGDEATPPSAGSPRSVYMENSSQYKAKQVEQLSYLVTSLYPSQKEQNEANTALKNYQTQVANGESGAILQIDTGNNVADSILKLICFWILNNASMKPFSFPK